MKFIPYYVIIILSEIFAKNLERVGMEMTTEAKIQIVELASKEGATEEQIERLSAALWPENTSEEAKGMSAKKLNAKIVSKMLRELGVPAHILGYKYLRTAILSCLEDESLINSITKRLYPAIGKEYGSSSSKVERAIRHAIEVSWNRGTMEGFEELFGCSVSPEKGKPTNAEFISAIVDSLKLENF